MLNIGTLPKDTREELNRIIAKAMGGSELLPEETGFLRARRDYLDVAQEERFAEILEGEKKEKTLDEMTKSELAKLLEDRGIDSGNYKSKAEMVAAIEEAGEQK